MGKVWSLTISLVVGTTALTGIVVAETVVSHTGSVDPVTENWIGYGGALRGPVIDDLGLGIDAWFVDDQSPDIGGGGGYEYILTSDEVNRALTEGWNLTTVLRVVEVSFADSPVGVWFEAGTKRWHMLFGKDDNGDPTVQLLEQASPPYGPIAQISGSGYHEYQLTYDLASDTADLYVDGELTISGYVGFPHNFSPRVRWGSGSSQATGLGHYNQVALEIGDQSCLPVPEGLIGWWPGDGNSADIVGGNHGVAHGGVAYAEGMVGDAFSFDGIDDYVAVADVPELDLSAGEFTLDLWVRSDVCLVPSYDSVPFITKESASAHDAYALGVRTGGLFIFVASVEEYPGTAGFATVAFGGNCTPDTWYHIAGTQSANAAKLYVNGMLVAVGSQDLGTAVSQKHSPPGSRLA